ncbi:hypothetical protein CONLIGDRAFT_578158 [Coniochaeta ligniaria NRRL 30616]|uniref:RanBD1 domain-containing protein n=1 Tax=Coniochaeta ligniaria NRRL 30616 TaxID=1408157 RepID=A0A1J7INJ8_9PEZI|nr:hypothetical protein CONLIGDRAFT_578158 [Coniochaeta ligniaria NRRL 30616]
MDPPQKKRGLFGGITSSLFGRSYASEQNGPTKSETTSHSYRRVDMPGATPPASRSTYNASPESPVKRASDAQLSSRKIIDRPARPSSKLSYSVNASDMQTAAKSSSALVRMPGDNPNKFNTISGSNFSASTTRPTADFSGTATTPRNLFRGSTLNARPGLSTFSPRVPYNTMKESFPPSTPGRPPRGATAEVNGRSLAHTNTSTLFEMRIPSPPRDLTGERLAKEVPEDNNRVGSVYADQYLAHYCPPDFDDLQRRQFFCVLDLRRLKYAANEIFAKKDWKINILNFAKEYEKSRSLIMLRYGLYEFKTVKASETVKKQWQKDHGIPTSDDENDDETYKSTSGQSTLSRGKRKAEEELVPKDTPLTASSSNLNKRRVKEPEPRAETTTPITTKNKRKADAEPDENQPSKLQKAAPASGKASATKSIFESIANGTSNDASPSLKPKPSPFFGATKPVTTNGGRSILDQPSPAPSSNIFGHLSDASKVSNEEEEESSGASGDETASDADGEAEESEAQEASQSDEPSVVASGGVATPQFGAGGLFAKKPAEAPSNTSSEAGDSTKGRSLFDRISYDKTGQPVRAFGDPGNMFAAGANGGNSFGSNFAFSGSQSQPTTANVFGTQPPAAGGSIFAGGLAPMGGTSTGTNSPFTFGGASSLATTPATGTPEPGAEQEDQGSKADGDDAPQEQISLTEGGPGEEDESVVHEVRAKALKLVVGGDSEGDSPGGKAAAAADKKNPWKTQGVGPLRFMKHKTTGAVRMLLRAEPRGHVALNKRILPDFNYKAENKYVKITTSNDAGNGLETWMIQVKTKELATALSEALETHKVANKRK